MFVSKKLGSEKILGTRKFLVKRNFGSLSGLEEQSCRHLLDTFQAPNKIPSKHLSVPRGHLPDTYYADPFPENFKKPFRQPPPPPEKNNKKKTETFLTLT